MHHIIYHTIVQENSEQARISKHMCGNVIITINRLAAERIPCLRYHITITRHAGGILYLTAMSASRCHQTQVGCIGRYASLSPAKLLTSQTYRIPGTHHWARCATRPSRVPDISIITHDLTPHIYITYTETKSKTQVQCMYQHISAKTSSHVKMLTNSLKTCQHISQVMHI